MTAGATRFDVIVLGVGGMGSAACWALARRGVRTLGLEQHTLGHALGSSHGQSRLIRQAYFEHPAYVPLLKSAYALWDEAGAAYGATLLHRTGLVIYGREDGTILSGVRRSSAEHAIPIVHLAPDQAAAAYPVFAPPPGFGAIMEPAAGYLEVETCVRALAQLAVAQGARIHEGERVLSCVESAAGVTVVTDRGRYEADHVVVTAGPWAAAGAFLPAAAARQLRVHRVPLFWFEAPAALACGRGAPCFGFEMDEGFIYGLPALDERGFKLGLHLPGAPVAAPEQVDRSMQAADLEPLVRFLRRCLPSVDPRPTAHTVCMYTMTPDEHFLVDRRGRTSYAAGFSGHGFKFATVIGELLADLALTGRTALPADFLRYRW